MNCPKCGANNSEVSNFCIKCGTLLNGTDFNVGNQIQNQSQIDMQNYNQINQSKQILGLEEKDNKQTVNLNQDNIIYNLEQNTNQNVNNTTYNQSQSTIQNVNNQPINNYQPKEEQPIYNYQAEKSDNNISNSIKNKNVDKKKIGLILGGLVLIGLIVVMMINLFSNNKINNESSLNGSDSPLIGSDSFFISYNNTSMLFSYNGEKIAEFGYSGSDLSFINGATVVNDKEQVGIISSTGKMIVDFGKYKYIYQNGSLFRCFDEDYNGVLLTSTGKEITKLSLGSKVIDYKDEFMLLKNDNQYTIYNYDGKKVGSFDLVDDTNPLFSVKDRYYAVNYNNTNYIYDIDNAKLVISFKSDDLFCVTNIKESNTNEIILNPCFMDAKNRKAYKYVKNGKIMFERTLDKGSIVFNGDLITIDGYDVLNLSILDENGNVLLEKDNTIQTIADDKNYVKGNTNGVAIYVNNKLKTEEVECSYANFNKNIATDGIYLMSYCSKNNEKRLYKFYKKDGTRLTQEDYKDATYFDNNGRAIVSQDKETYYLIDMNGKQISEEYKSIRLSEYTNIINDRKYYIATKSDGSVSIIDKDAKVYLTLNNKPVDLKKGIKAVFASVKNGDKYEIYNVNTGKLITTVDSEPRFEDNYFTIRSEDYKKKYYSYENGKLFFEEK